MRLRSLGLRRRRRLPALPGCLAALLVCGLAGGCSEGEARRPPNLLLLVVDTLRQDHLGAYGYADRPTSPVLDALAANGVRVEGLTCVSSWTKPSMATLLTGLTPVEHGVASIPHPLREEETLARVLGDAGYETACVMSNFLLGATHMGHSTGFQTGFEYYDDEITRQEDPHFGSTAPEVVRRGRNWLEQRPPGRPWFLMLHFFDPHVAYEDHEEYAFEDPGYEGWVEPHLRRGILRKHQETCSPEDRRQLSAFYDEEVRAVDDALGALLEYLEQRDDWDDTLVVFTSDHGEELSERGYIGHTVSLHFELTDLPLVLRLPGDARAGTELRARLSQRDAFATLLDLCEQPVPDGRGRTFAPILRGEEEPWDRLCFSEVSFQPLSENRSEKETRMRSVIGDGFKLVRDRIEGTWELYDLAQDPGEQQDLAGMPSFAEVEERLKEHIRRHRWQP